MALTHLDKLPSYEEWKENNPVDPRGIPLGQDEVQLRAGYAHYFMQQAQNVPQGFEKPRPDELEMVGSKLANFIADAQEVRSKEAVQSAYDQLYSIPDEEKVDRIFREQVDGGVGGTAPPYILLREAVSGNELRAQLDAQNFDSNKFFRIADKIDKISGPNKQTPSVELNYIDGKAVFSSSADDFPELWTVTEEEQAYVDQFSDVVKQYAKKVWPDYKQLVHRQRGASVIEVPFTDPETQEVGSKFIFADNVPEDEREESVDRSIREGFIDYRARGYALDTLANGLQLENSDERRPVKTQNYLEVKRMISSALKKGGPHTGTMMSQLENLMQQVVLSHSKSGGDLPSFVTTPEGNFLAQTELVETKGDTLVNQNYAGAVGDFRQMFKGSSEHLSDEVIGKAFQSMAYQMAAANTMLPYHESKMRAVWQGKKTLKKDSAKRVANNIYTTEFGEKIIHPGLLVSKLDFENLKENAEELGLTKDQLEARRLAYLGSKYDYFLTNIYNSTADIRNSWIAHVGKTSDSVQASLREVSPGQWVSDEGGAEVLASWLDSESGRNFWNRTVRAASQGAGDLVGALGMFGAGIVGDTVDFWTGGVGYLDDGPNTEMEKNMASVLAISARERQADRAIASMFGRKHTFADTAFTMAVPLAIDIGASFALAAPTAGVGSTAYASAALSKYGLTATAKSYITGAFGFGLRNILKDGAEDTMRLSLEKAYARGYIKTLPSVKKYAKEADNLLPGWSGTVSGAKGQVALKSSFLRATDGGLSKMTLGNLPQGVLPKRFVENVIKNSKSAKRVSAALPMSMRSEAAVDALTAIGRGIRAGQYPAISAPAFLRSSAHTYGDVHMALQGATGSDGKPLSAEEIHDRAFGGAVMGGMFTVATVVGLQRLGMGGLEDWVTGGATTGQVKRVFEKLRNKKYVNFNNFVTDVANKVVGDGIKFAWLRGPIARGAAFEGLQEGFDAFLNTFARSAAMAGTSASDMDRPFMDRLKEGGMGAIYGVVLGAGAPALAKGGRGLKGLFKSELTKLSEQAQVERETLPKIARKIHKQLVAKLEESGSPQSAATVEEILGGLQVAARSLPEEAIAARLKDREKQREQSKDESSSDHDINTADKIEQEIVDLQVKLAAATSEEEQKRLEGEVATLITELSILRAKSAETSTGDPEAEQSKKDAAESSEADPESEQAQLQENNTRAALEALGLIIQDPTNPEAFRAAEVDLANFFNVIAAPAQADEADRKAALAVVDKALKEKLNTSKDNNDRAALRESKGYLEEQLLKGVTEEEADQNLDNANEEDVKIAIEEALLEGAGGGDTSSGTGESTVSVSDKEQLVQGVLERLRATESQRDLEYRRTDEELERTAIEFVEKAMQPLRRDLREQEDLRAIGNIEEELLDRLAGLREEFESLHKAQSLRLGRKGYKAGGGHQGRPLGANSLTERPNDADIGAVSNLIAGKEEAFNDPEAEELPARQQELTLLRSLRDVLTGLKTINDRRAEIEGASRRQQQLEEQLEREQERERVAALRKAEAEEAAKKKAAKKAAKKKAAKKKKGKQPPEPEPAGPTILYTGQSEDLPSFTDYDFRRVGRSERGGAAPMEGFAALGPGIYFLTDEAAVEHVYKKRGKLMSAEVDESAHLILDPTKKNYGLDEARYATVLKALDNAAQEIGFKDYDALSDKASDQRNLYRLEPTYSHLRDGARPVGNFVHVLRGTGDLEGGVIAEVTQGWLPDRSGVNALRIGREKARELLVKHGIKGMKQELPGGSVEYSIFDPSILTVESAPQEPESEPEPPAPEPLRETFEQNMIAAGALKSRSEGDWPVAAMGIPNSLKLNTLNKSKTSRTIIQGIIADHPILGDKIADESGEGLRPRKKLEVKQHLEEHGVFIPDHQWLGGRGVTSSGVKFGGSTVWLIRDVDGGIFDDGEGGRPDELVILFNNDPRAMAKAMDELGHYSIPIPVGFSGDKVNKTFRGDRAGETLSQDTKEVYDIFYPVGSDLSKETSILGNKERSRVANPEVTTGKISQKVQFLMHFVDEDTALEIRVDENNLDAKTAATAPNKVTIGTYVRILADWVNNNYGSIQVPTSKGKMDLIEKVNDSERGAQERQDIRSLYLTGLTARAERAAVEVALIQAMENKREDQSDADALVAAIHDNVTIPEDMASDPMYAAALKIFKSMAGEGVSVESGRGAAAFALSEFLMGSRIATSTALEKALKKDPDIDVLDFILGKVAEALKASTTRGDTPRNKGAANPSAEGAIRPVPNLYNPARDIIKLQVDRAMQLYADNSVRGMSNRAQSLDREDTFDSLGAELSGRGDEEADKGVGAEAPEGVGRPADVGVGLGDVGAGQASGLDVGEGEVVEETGAREKTKEALELQERMEAIPDFQPIKDELTSALETILDENLEANAALNEFYDGLDEHVADMRGAQTSLHKYLELSVTLQKLVSDPLALGISEEESQNVERAIEKLRVKFSNEFGAAVKDSKLGLLALAEIFSSNTLHTKDVKQTLNGLQDGFFTQAVDSVAGASLDQIAEVVNIERAVRGSRAPAFQDSLHQRAAFSLNREEAAALGLVDGDIYSVLKAIEDLAYGDSALGIPTRSRIMRKGALAEAGKASLDPNLQLSARLLSAFRKEISELDFRIVRGGTHFAGSFVPSDSFAGTIYLNLNARYGEGVRSVILHEVAHAVFARIMNTPDSELTTAQRAARKQMEVLYDRTYEAWLKAKARGKADPLMDYVFGTGRRVVRATDEGGLIDPRTGLQDPEQYEPVGVAASGEVTMESTSDEDLDLAGVIGEPSDLILPRTIGYEEFFTTFISSAAFQAATRKIAVENRSVFRRMMDLVVKLVNKETKVEREAAEALEYVYNFANFKNAPENTSHLSVTLNEEQVFVNQQVNELIENHNRGRRAHNHLRDILGLDATAVSIAQDPLQFERHKTPNGVLRKSWFKGVSPEAEVERALYDEYVRLERAHNKKGRDDWDIMDGDQRSAWSEQATKLRKNRFRVIFDRLFKDEVARQAPDGVRVLYLESHEREPGGTQPVGEIAVAYQTILETKLDAEPDESGVDETGYAPAVVFVMDKLFESMLQWSGKFSTARGDGYEKVAAGYLTNILGTEGFFMPKSIRPSGVGPVGPTADVPSPDARLDYYRFGEMEGKDLDFGGFEEGYVSGRTRRTRQLTARERKRISILSAYMLKDAIEAVVSEEFIHGVEHLVIPQELRDEVIEELGEEGIIEMAYEYYRHSPRFRKQMGVYKKGDDPDLEEVLEDIREGFKQFKQRTPPAPGELVGARTQYPDQGSKVVQLHVMLSEGLRREVQKRIKSGISTERASLLHRRLVDGEYTPYDPTRPIFMRLVKRQLIGVFNKLLSRMTDLRADLGDAVPNPRFLEMVQRVHLSLKMLQDGELEELGFRDIEGQFGEPLGSIKFDPENPSAGIRAAFNTFDRADRISARLKDGKKLSPQEEEEHKRDVEALLREQLINSIEIGHLFQNGEFQHLSDIEGKWGTKYAKQFATWLARGKQDPRVMRMLKDYERWSEAVNALLKTDMLHMEKLLKKAFGKTPSPEILKALNAAAGTTDSLDIDPETKARVHARYKAAVARVRKEVRENKRPAEHISPEALQDMKTMLVHRVEEQLRLNLVEEFKETQKQARAFLEESTPQNPQLGRDVVSAILAVRATIDSLSKLISKQYKLTDVRGGKIGVIFDRMGGIYLTRGYRAHNDIAYLREVMNPDGKFQDRRDAALPFFEGEQVKVEKKKIKKELLALIESLDAGVTFTDPAQEAEAKILKKLSDKELNQLVTKRAEDLVTRDNKGVAALNEFLATLLDTAEGKRVDYKDIKKSQGEAVASLTRVQVDNLRSKGDVDEGVRYLLGQFGLERTEDGSFEEHGLASLYATVTMQTRMAESMTFLNDLKEVGGVKDGNVKDAFVFTYEEAEAAGLMEAGARPYVNFRTGLPLRPLSSKVEGKGFVSMFDPSLDMYVPEDLYTSLQAYRNVSRGNAATTLYDIADRSGSTLVKGAAHLTNAFLKLNSLFMFSKTVANVPTYHFRNAITAVTSYGMAALVNPLSVVSEFVMAFGRTRKAARGESKAKALIIGRDPRLKTTRSIIDQRLGIDQSQMDLNYLEQVATQNSKNPYGIFFDGTKELMALSPKDMTEENLVKKGLLVVTKGGDYVLGGAFRRLVDFAQGIDYAGKRAMYKSELKALRDARDYDKENNVDTGFLNMTEEQLEFEAARKARAMSPVYSEAPNFAKSLRRYNAFHADPFLSFWLDQFRIVHNQMRAIPKEEMESSNPVMQARGAQRLAAAVTVHGGMSLALPIASAVVLGINPTDEEEELLKEAAPPWGKLNQYIYLPGHLLKKVLGFTGQEFEEDALYSLDLTYINAASPVFDGSTAAILELLRGDYQTAALNLWQGYTQRFINPGFIRSTLKETYENKDGTVFNEGDPLKTKMLKGLGHFAKRAVEPGNLRRLREWESSQGADDETLKRSFEETITQIMLPATPRKVRLDLAIYKAARSRQIERKNLTDVVYRTLRDGSRDMDGPKGDREIEELAKRVIEQRKRIDAELVGMVQDAMNMEAGAITRQEALERLKYAGIGPARRRGIVDYRATERYLPSVDMRREFNVEGFKKDRFERFEKALIKFGPKARFTNVDTGERIVIEKSK